MKLIARLLALAAIAAVPVLAQVAGNLGPGFDARVIGNFVLTTAVQPDRQILIAGGFNEVGGQTRNHLARLNPDGTLEDIATFNPGTGPNYYVNGVAVQDDGKIIIVGEFTSYDGQPRNHIARLNADGSLENLGTFNVGSGTNYEINSVALQPDGKILIVGNFSTFNGQPRGRIARLNPDGTLEAAGTFDVGTGADTVVYCVAVQPDGKILIGGRFTSVNGLARTRIARLKRNGNVESTATFDTGTGSNGSVLSIVVQPDTRILVGGNFAAFSSLDRNNLVRLDARGVVEDAFAFNIGRGPNSYVNSIALQADGKIIIGGDFRTVSSQARNYVARLLPDGTLEDAGTFNSSPGPSNIVDSVAQQANGKILIGGIFFNRVDTQPRNLVARLLNDATAPSVLTVGGSRVNWARGGSAPEVEQVTFELSTDAGANWSPLGVGVRVAGGWKVTGLSLPLRGSIRVRGRVVGGQFDGSSGLVEQVVSFAPASPIADALISKDAVGGFVGGGIRNTTGDGQTERAHADVGSGRTFAVKVRNVGLAGSFTVSGTAKTVGFTVQYFDDLGADITAEVTAGTYQTADLPENGEAMFAVRITAKANAPVGSVKTCKITVARIGGASAEAGDRVKAVLIAR